ncbi:hypothetical protein SPBR_00264 [Sporothrix brasiliensis 5110]|uniref:Uncharacterized protein n=1 Tax=Sporothrix brasiliensis 5110 TaxID=1398154 RepID=A0A0C2ITV1_9PEZI|nr:uncharacterized protein SPBR_00264 [Sporothrix brasiliensis 5110]KIH90205.1 hypothetical protein SPBR_00264 [Sporothrix brasiliensis 5110]
MATDPKKRRRLVRHAPVVKIRRVDEEQRNTGQRPNEGHKPVEVAGAQHGDGTAGHRQRSAQGVLGPLDARVAFARAVVDSTVARRRLGAEEAAVDDAHGGEELHRHARQHGNRVQTLHGLHEGAGAGVVVNDLGLGAGAKRCVAKRADGDVRRRDNGHDDAEQPAKPLGAGHGRLDGQDEADALKGKDGGADCQRIARRVEPQIDRLVHAPAARRNGSHVVRVHVHEADGDEDVAEQGGGAEARNVAHETERDQHGHFESNKGVGRQDAVVHASLSSSSIKRIAARVGVRHGRRKRRQILGCKDNAGTHKPQLRKRNGPQDQAAHARARNGQANVAVAATIPLAAAQQQLEAAHGQHGDDEQGDRREDHAAVVEGLGQKHDARADKGLEQREKGLGHAGFGLATAVASGVAARRGHNSTRRPPAKQWLPFVRPPPKTTAGSHPTLHVFDASSSLLFFFFYFLVLLFDLLLGTAFILLVVRRFQVFVGKMAVELEKLDKVARNRHLHGTKRGGPPLAQVCPPPLHRRLAFLQLALPDLLQHKIAAETLRRQQVAHLHLGPVSVAVPAVLASVLAAVAVGAASHAAHFAGCSEEISSRCSAPASPSASSLPDRMDADVDAAGARDGVLRCGSDAPPLAPLSPLGLRPPAAGRSLSAYGAVLPGAVCCWSSGTKSAV